VHCLVIVCQSVLCFTFLELFCERYFAFLKKGFTILF